MSTARKDENRQIDAQIGANIRALRRARDMSQERLAGLINVTFQQIQKYEKGANRVSGSMLYRIAQAFDVHVGALYTGIPGATTDAEASGFDRLADKAEVRRLRETVARVRDVVGIPVPSGPLPAVHTSR